MTTIKYYKTEWQKLVVPLVTLAVLLFNVIGFLFGGSVYAAPTVRIDEGPTGYSYQIKNRNGNAPYAHGLAFNRIYVNGEIAFCVQPGVVLKNGQAYTVKETAEGLVIDQRVNNVLTQAQIDHINQIIFWGWDMSDDQSNFRYALVQSAVWRALGWDFDSLSGHGLSVAKVREFEQDIARHLTRTTSFNGQTVTLKVGESQTLTDTNGNLQYLTFDNKDGWEFNHNGNSVTITPTSNATSTSVRSENRRLRGGTKTSIVLFHPNSQNVIQVKDPNRVYATLNLNVIKHGQVKIVKTDASSGKAIEGVEFTLYNATTNEAVKTVKTDNNGVAQVLDLDPAQSFYFKETRGKNGYMLNHKRYDVTVKAGETTTVNVSNEPVPTIHTKATAKSGGKESYAYEKHQEIANMSNLVIGTTYNVLATQYSSTGEVLATQERSFVAKATSHTEVFEFSVPVKYVGDIVYGEDLFRDGEKVATHFDLKNKEQTVKVIEPKVETKATTLNGGKESYVFEKHYEVAKVSGLIVGFEYKLVATQYSSTGKVLATQERTFVAKEKEHEETFEFDVPVKYVGDIVYGEDLYRDGEKIAVHYDLSNKEQTIKVLEPKINTLAQIGGMKEQFVGEKKELVDTLTYTDFKNGKVLVRTWVVKYGTDEVVGEVVEQVLELDGNGEVTVKLDKIDTSKLPAGKYTIMEQVFEVVEKDGVVEKGNKISEHVDPRDDNQSFTVKERPVFPLLPQTSTGSFVGVIGLGIVMIVGSVFVYRKRDNV